MVLVGGLMRDRILGSMYAEVPRGGIFEFPAIFSPLHFAFL